MFSLDLTEKLVYLNYQLTVYFNIIFDDLTFKLPN